MRLLAAIPVGLLLGAGCTILSGVGDLEAVGPSDAGTKDVDVELVVDARADATLDDTGASPVDAGQDVVTTRSFCDGVPASVEICFDFDSKSIEKSPERSELGSTLTVDAPGRDSNLALHCAGVDDAEIQCMYVVPLPASPTKLRWTFDLRVEAPGAGIEFNEIQFDYVVGRCVLQPALYDGTFNINEYCPGQGAPDQVDHPIVKIDPAAGWYAFDITLDLGHHEMSGSVQPPSGAPTSFGPITLDPRFVTSSEVKLHAGLSYGVKSKPAADIRTDNITVDVQ